MKEDRTAGHVEHTHVLNMTGVTYAYSSSTADEFALRDIEVTVAPGEWVAMMGPSGSGKSTLLLCAAGLLRPLGGSVVLDGLELVEATEKQLTTLRRQRVGFIFQEYNLVAALTVAQNVELPGRFSRSRPSKQNVLEALGRVGLEEKAGVRPDELSGGQRQRVAVARALVTQPAMIFADEPTGALDTQSGDRVLDEFETLKSNHTAVLMVTHDPRVAARADRVVWLRDGRIVDHMVCASAEDIAARLAHLEEPLG